MTKKKKILVFIWWFSNECQQLSRQHIPGALKPYVGREETARGVPNTVLIQQTEEKSEKGHLAWIIPAGAAVQGTQIAQLVRCLSDFTSSGDSTAH